MMTSTGSNPLLGRLAKASESGAAGGSAQSPASGSSESAVDPKRRLSASLIVNPYSSGMTAKRERDIVLELRTQFDVQVLRTEHAGHAPELAREAWQNGADVLFACGGDGTANEVLNGLELADGTAEQRPLVALIPAGGTNVLCRSLGIPNHPLKAARHMMDAIRDGRWQTINLGRLDERLFLFAAGVGFDGEVVRRIENKRTGRRPSDLAHVATVLGIFMHERLRFDERITVEVEATGETLRASMLMCGNTTPMSYLGKVPMHFMPACRLDTGLDFIAPRRLGPAFFLRSGARALGKRAANRPPEAAPDAQQMRCDLRAFTVTCDSPQSCQVDGEFIGERTHIRFTSVESPIRLVS
jgi:diacylglycerol kinase family enzyme